MTAVYTKAPEVQKIAEKLIEKYHQHLTDFNVRVDYYFVDKTPVRGGKEVWGTCRKVTSLNAFLAADDQSGGDPFYVIVISEPIWEMLPPDKKEALVDHELCHAGAEYQEKDDEEPAVKLNLKPHDLEEFACIVRRHGLWREDIEEFLVNAKIK
jgi:hypothetical protein